MTDETCYREMIEAWESRTGASLLVRRLREVLLDDEQVWDVLAVIDGVCQNCWNADAGCKCTRDE